MKEIIYEEYLKNKKVIFDFMYFLAKTLWESQYNISSFTSVSTIPDECKGVEPEIGTGSKRKAIERQIIQSVLMATSDNMCRTANGWDINGLGQRKDGRGNICPVTIILPTLAMEATEKYANCDYYDARDGIASFMDLLDQKIHEAKDMLLERFEYICAQPAGSAKFMYENGLMAGYDGKTTRSALCHGTLALGQLGLAECLQILIGKDHTTPEGMELAKKIEALFKQRCAEFKEQYKLNFGVYQTPKISDWVSRK